MVMLKKVLYFFVIQHFLLIIPSFFELLKFIGGGVGILYTDFSYKENLCSCLFILICHPYFGLLRCLFSISCVGLNKKMTYRRTAFAGISLTGNQDNKTQQNKIQPKKHLCFINKTRCATAKVLDLLSFAQWVVNGTKKKNILSKFCLLFSLNFTQWYWKNINYRISLFKVNNSDIKTTLYHNTKILR